MPVLGWRHDWFPAFYTRSSGLPVPHRVETAGEVAAVLASRSRRETGVLVAVPIPEAAELDPGELDAVLVAALDDAASRTLTGAAVTPFVLGRIAVATAGPQRPRQPRPRRAQRRRRRRDRRGDRRQPSAARTEQLAVAQHGHRPVLADDDDRRRESSKL